MTVNTITSALRTVVLAAFVTSAAALGTTALGHLATADAAPPKSVITNPNAMQNCRLMGGTWVWDGFEMGHCEFRRAPVAVVR